MNLNKQCPLLAKTAWPKCIKGECAWYLVQSKQCAIPLLASAVQRLNFGLALIESHLKKQCELME